MRDDTRGPVLDAGVDGRGTREDCEVGLAAGRGKSELAGRFVETKPSRGSDAVGDGFRGAERQSVVGAKIGDERTIQKVVGRRFRVLKVLGREAVADAELMLELPEIVVLCGRIQAPVGSAGSVLVVDFDAAVKGEPVLDSELEGTGAGLGAGSDDGEDLPVAILVGDIEFPLKDAAVEEFVGFETGKGADDVVGAEAGLFVELGLNSGGSVRSGEPSWTSTLRMPSLRSWRGGRSVALGKPRSRKADWRWARASRI